ncbi:MAG: magnesium transporter CorA family protein [Thermoplasmata archaeon]|nr:magnesium transporter CorA family protein [Thermoplasmata archaeon]
MMEIYEMMDGRPVRTDEIKEDVWINLVAPTVEEIDLVQGFLGIDREALTSALDDEEGSRTEVSKDYTLILVDAPTREWRNSREEFTTYPVSITVTDTAIVTVCLQELFAISNITSGKVKGKSIFDVSNRARFVLQILFRIAINYQTDLKYIEVKRMAIEESIRKATRRDDLFELHELESNLVYFKTSLSVNASIIERMSKQSRFVSTPEDRDLMDDVIIETNQALEMTMTYSQIIKGTRQLVEADLNNSLALVMKFLTSITLIIAIPTMLASFYGMNVSLPGEDFEYAYVVLLVAMVALCALSIWGLRRKGLWKRSETWRRPSAAIPA